MKLTTIATILILGSAAVHAGDFKPKAQPTGAVEVLSMAGQAPYQQPVTEEYMSAEEKLQDYMETRGWAEGWSEDKKRMMVIQSESFDTENPAWDSGFMAKRGVFSTMAVMGAKASIVEFMRTQMSAIDQMDAPGTDVHAELSKQYAQAQKKFLAQKRIVAQLLKNVDSAQAKALEGITWNDRGKALLDAAIKKLDDSFDSSQIEDKKLKQFKLAKTNYAAANKTLSELSKQAEAIRGQEKLKTYSSVETLAKAPLMGAIVVAQAESWNEEDGQYEVASLVVWSNKLEQAARSLASNTFIPTKPKDGMTVQEWVKKQDLATMTGSRQMVDKDGQRWFLGAASSSYSGSSSAKRKAKGMAELFAKKEAVISIYADIETHKQALRASSTRSTGLGQSDNTQVAESFAQSTRQSIENRQVSGLAKVIGKRVKHPISDQDIYVVVYAISPKSAQQALVMEKVSFQGAIMADSAQLVQKGTRAGYEKAITDNKNDMAAYQKAQAAAQVSATEKVSVANKSIKKNQDVTTQSTNSKSKVVVNGSDDDDF